jgi:hypothetical protein
VRILLATDGSHGTEKALRFLLSLPLSVSDDVTVLTVPRYTFVATEDGDAAEAIPAGRDLRETAGVVAQNASALFASRNIPTGTLAADGPVAEAIERAAIERSEWPRRDRRRRSWEHRPRARAPRPGVPVLRRGHCAVLIAKPPLASRPVAADARAGPYVVLSLA